MSVKFTVDGYTEAMKPRPSGVAMGAAVMVVSLVVSWFATLCVGIPLLLIGAMMIANERGQRRYRVTSSQLLIEDEPLVRGFIIGPIRNRIPWDAVKEVGREGQAVKLSTTDGRTLLLGEGGTEQELERFLGRIKVSMEPD